MTISNGSIISGSDLNQQFDFATDLQTSARTKAGEFSVTHWFREVLSSTNSSLLTTTITIPDDDFQLVRLSADIRNTSTKLTQ